MSNNFDYIEHNKVIWNSRRGLLELDILLENFVKTEYVKLDHNSRLNYQKLLTHEDQLLYDWFLKKKPIDENFIEIIELILSFNKRFFSK